MLRSVLTKQHFLIIRGFVIVAETQHHFQFKRSRHKSGFIDGKRFLSWTRNVNDANSQNKEQEQGHFKNQNSQSQEKEKEEDTSNEDQQQKQKTESTTSHATSLVPSSFFSLHKDKNKNSFLIAIEMFTERDKHRRGHVEFIYSALKNMKQFGVHRDLETYKRIFDVFPKGKFIATNMFQVEFMHFPKQQQCAIHILEQMEEYSVIPDGEIQTMIELTFGKRAFPMRKFMRMLYWMPKFKNLSPWPLPDVLPQSSLELAKLAIQRITSVDLETKITCLNAMDLEDAIDHTWIVSGQSPSQQKLIEEHSADRPVYVEGAFRVWLQSTCINYFILRAEPKVRPKVEKDVDDVGILQSIFQETYTETQLATVPTVHEQEDGVILACCATGTSSRDSVLSWIRFLEESNPRLGKDISVLFTLKSPIGPTDDLEPPQSIEDGQEHGQEQFLLDNKSPKDYNRLGNLDFDPMVVNLNQVGIGEFSDSKFINWPHHHRKPVASDTSRLKSNDQDIKIHERLTDHTKNTENS